MRLLLPVFLGIANVSGCSVIAVADTAAIVAATTIKVGAKVVAATVDVAAAGATW